MITKFLSIGTVFVLLFSGVLLFGGCKKKQGCTDPESSNYDPEAKKDDGSCEDILGEEISGTHSSPLILENIIDDPSQVDYYLTQDLRMESDLVIKPGVVIQLNTGRNIVITSLGSISAAGTADQPILITGAQKAPGAWGNVLLESKSSKNEFRYVTIEYGGDDYQGANLYVQYDAEFKMTNSTIRHSKNQGIVVNVSNSHATSIPEFSNNVISNNGGYGISITAGQMEDMNATNQIKSNGFDMIQVNGGTLAVTTEIAKTTVPYLISRHLAIEADVKLHPGVHLLMGSNVYLQVKETGSLNAEGTSVNKIIIKAEKEVSGHFRNIQLTSTSTKNVFDHVEVGYGGSYGGNIYINGGRLSMGNSYIHHSADWGVYVNTYGNGIFKDLGGNTFENNTSGDIG